MTVHAQDVSKLLANQAELVAMYLLPNGRKQGKEWVSGSINGEKGNSLKVCLLGSKAGVWCDFAVGSQLSGDLLDLWSAVMGISFIEALSQAKTYLGLSSHIPTLVSPKQKQFIRPNKPACQKPKGQLLDYLTQTRLIQAEVIEAYKVAVTQNGEIVFPLLRDEALINIKYLTPRKAEGQKNQWRQETEAEPCLFGWQAIGDHVRSIVITEGEIDCLSVASIGGYALSIPAGANNLDWLVYEYERLLRFDDIVLLFDMDEVGRKHVYEIAQRLGLERTRVANLPVKDANQMLCNGKGFELGVAIKTAPYCDPEELQSAKAFKEDVTAIFNGTSPMLQGSSMPFEKANGKIAFGKNQVTLWQGINGHGKSLFLGYVMLGLIEQKERICIFSGEILPKMTLWRMVCQLVGSQSPDQKWIDRAFDFMDDRVWIFNELGNAKWKRLIEVFQYASKRFGITQFVIDSFACCGIAEDDYKGQKEFIEALRTFKFKYDVHIHLVIHPRKTDSEDKVPDKMDAKGTGAITDLVDNMLTVFRVKKNEQAKHAAKTDKEKDLVKNLPDVHLYTNKNRFGSWEGVIYLWFNPNSFQYFDNPTQHHRQWLLDEAIHDNYN